MNDNPINVEISNLQAALKHSMDGHIGEVDRVGSITEAGCEEWVQIVKEYQAAVRGYSEATAELSGVPGVEFNIAWMRAESLRKESKRLRATLLEHEHKHRCSVARARTP